MTVAGAIVAVMPLPGCDTASWMLLPVAVDLKAAVDTVNVVTPRWIIEPRAGKSDIAKSGAVVQPGSWNVITRVRQVFFSPSKGTYSEVYQKVQSSTGSTEMLL